MHITVDTVLAVASLITAAGAILGVFLGAARWFLRQNKQDEDIRQLKDENRLIVRALCACLDGLEQLGANHKVTQVKDELDRYINEQAHK